MAPMPPDMPTGQDVIHLEADVHATADNVYGYPDGSWVPYLAIEYSLVPAINGPRVRANETTTALLNP
jgi:uncharacterized protein involved in high-affinity Fe2+ transport